MTLDAPDAGRRASEEDPSNVESAESSPSGRAVAVLAAALLGAAFLGAATAGVLPTVGPYLLGVSALGLFLLAVALR